MNFRNRLNSAFQAISNVIGTVFSRFFTFCKTKPVEVISVVGVIASLYYSQKSLDKTVDAINQSDAQFQDNNKSQDEQDKRSREQHDSLMSVLKQQKTLLDLQLVSLKQQNEIVTRNLGVSKTQLKLAEEIQRREIEGGRCLLTIEGNSEIQDTSKKLSDFWNPIIFTEITNKGKRPCLSYRIETAFLSKVFNISKHGVIESYNPINAGQTIRHGAQSIVEDNKDFYYFVKLAYKDIITNKEYVTQYYFHYKLVRGEHIFYHAQGEEITKMQKALKERN
jgi:hypothetical protein